MKDIWNPSFRWNKVSGRWSKTIFFDLLDDQSQQSQTTTLSGAFDDLVGILHGGYWDDNGYFQDVDNWIDIPV